MQIDLYDKYFSEQLKSSETRELISKSVDLVKKSKRLFFLGNGGSNAICSHMMEDFAKRGRYPTFSFSDPALITCFSNDYGYEKAMEEWIKIHVTEGDLLFAISSGGESKNIRNAAAFMKSKEQAVITLSGFKKENSLSQMGDVNFHVPIEDYGIVECVHHTLVHIILDEVCDHS